jgi:hypothetical protein
MRYIVYHLKAKAGNYFCYLLITLSLIFTAFSFAEDKDINVSVFMDKNEITIGSRIVLAVKVFVTDNIASVNLEEIVNLAPFEIKDFKVYKDKKIDDGRILKRIDYIVTSYETGEYEIPSININYINKDNSNANISTQKLKVNVKSVLPEDTKEIKDIKDIKDIFIIKADLLKLILIVLGSFLVSLLIFWGIWFWRKRKSLTEKIELKVVRFEEEVAYEVLQALLEEDLIEKHKIKEYYLKLSNIIKVYLEDRYKIPAVEYTTYEIVTSLKKIDINRESFRLLQKFLKDSDLAKFAKWEPDKQFCLRSFQDAKHIVDKTKKQRTAITEDIFSKEIVK